MFFYILSITLYILSIIHNLSAYQIIQRLFSNELRRSSLSSAFFSEFSACLELQHLLHPSSSTPPKCIQPPSLLKAIQPYSPATASRQLLLYRIYGSCNCNKTALLPAFFFPASFSVFCRNFLHIEVTLFFPKEVFNEDLLHLLLIFPV